MSNTDVNKKKSGKKLVLIIILSTLAFLETVIDEYRLKDHRKTINEIRNIVLKEYQNQRYFTRKIPVFFAQKRV